MMKRFLTILLVLSLLTISMTAFAATSITNAISLSGGELDDVIPFKFEHKKQGIDCGVCPVYSAPSPDAYRAANGRATVDTNSRIDIGGFENGWLLVLRSM